MKTLVSALLIILSIQYVSIAQDSQNDEQYNSKQLIKASVTSAISPSALRVRRNMKGTPYYNKEWLPGVVLIDKNLKSGGVLLRYDPYDNLVFYKQKGSDKVLALNNKYVRGFYLDKKNKKEFFRNGFKSDKKDITPYTYLRVIHDGKTKLLVDHRTYVRKSHTSPMASGTISNEFKHREEYYFQDRNGALHKIRLKRKDLFKHINKKYKSPLKKYAKKNDLDFGSEQGMSNILGYYDQLLAKNG